MNQFKSFGNENAFSSAVDLFLHVELVLFVFVRGTSLESSHGPLDRFEDFS
jgi:hypothetical protein